VLLVITVTAAAGLRRLDVRTTGAWTASLGHSDTSPALVEKVRSALLAIDDPELLREARITGFTQSQTQRLERLKERVLLQ
ncbi:MAG: hypothetical protein R6Y91_03425, partial [Desulfohalobium sp.]